MKALILSAGKGTRLRPLTFFKPKPMVEVGGKPILEHLVEHLEKRGIYDIMVNLHYKPLHIMEYFGTRLEYVYEPKLLGEEGTIQSLKDWVGDRYLIVMNGDTLTNIDLYAMFDMGKGKSVQSIDNGVYTGTKILSPRYFKGNTKIQDYSHSKTWWLDCGTHKNLRLARKLFNEKLNNLPDLQEPGDQVDTGRVNA